MPNNTLKMGEKKILEHHGESNSSAIHNAKHFYKSENTSCRHPKQQEKHHDLFESNFEFFFTETSES